MDILQKFPNENEKQYIWRIGQMIDAGKFESWKSVANIINKELRADESEYRDESAYRKPYQYAKGFYEEVFAKMIDDEYAKQIQLEKRELQKERVKFQTEKGEYNRWLREDARNDLIIEKLTDAIKSIPPLPPVTYIPRMQSTRKHVLLMGDEHDGAEFCIKGLFGEVINEYSPEIFEDRMWKLLNEIIAYKDKENISEISILNFGDSVAGVLRVGQLMQLRWGVVDSVAHYENFMANWLNELTKQHLRVTFQMVHGNHSELRFFNQPKGAFGEENMGKLVVDYIKARLYDNPNFTYRENPTGLIFDNIAGYNILGIHGEVKDMKKALGDFSNFYKVNIDYLIGGHLHHLECEDVGVDSEIIRVNSIMGTDPHAKTLIKSSNAGAKINCFEEGFGIVDEHRIKLN